MADAILQYHYYYYTQVLLILKSLHPLSQVHHASAGSGGGGRWRRAEQTGSCHAPGCGGLRRQAGGDSHHDQVSCAFQHQAHLPAHLCWRSASRQFHGSCELEIFESVLQFACWPYPVLCICTCNSIFDLCSSWNRGLVSFAPSSTTQSTPSASPVRTQQSGRNSSNPAPLRGSSYLWVTNKEKMHQSSL